MKLKTYALVATCFLISGCGTILTLTDERDSKNYVYSGVKFDLEGIKHSQDPDSSYIIYPWIEFTTSAIDMPFSACADTIVLPYTMPKARYFETANKTKSTEQNAAEQPATRL